jgi:hypothetical protein
MTAKTNAWETDLLALLFNNTNAANIGDATGLRGATTAGSLYLSLHTADPGEAGDQTTNEISYTGYARVATARSATDWTVSGNVASLAQNKDFAQSTGGTGGTATHFGVGTSGTGKLLYKGTISPTIAVANGVAPRLNAGTQITED